MDLQALIGIRLAALRDAKGMTQLQVAKGAGVTSQYLGRIEGGERAPSFKVLQALARTLDVEPVEFFRPEDARERREVKPNVVLAQLTGAAERLSPADLETVLGLVRRLGRR